MRAWFSAQSVANALTCLAQHREKPAMAITIGHRAGRLRPPLAETAGAVGLSEQAQAAIPGT